MLLCRNYEADVESISSESDQSSSSSEDEGEEDVKGTCLNQLQDFNPSKLELIKSGDDCYTLSYENDTRFYVKSGQFIGDFTLYDSKFSKSILLKKGELLEAVREKIEKMLGKKSKVSFYGKNESSCASFFMETVRNADKKKCLNAMENGTPRLIPVEELDEKTGCLTAVLRSGKIVKRQKHEFNWKLSITEILLDPVPKEYEGYFKVAKKPRISFFTK